MSARRLARPLALAAALALAAFAGPDVKTKFDATADFVDMHSYSWVTTTPPAGAVVPTWNQVHAAIDRDLKARGYTQAQPGDFAIGFTLGRRQQTKTWDLGQQYGGWGGPGPVDWSGGSPDVIDYTEGTLAIDVFDAKTKRPLWHGALSQRISAVPDQAEIDAAVKTVLDKFPPPPK
ncbi:DUF4136 domain-containing protein [Caulobacter sp. 17J65-9]|uniref:DUF4136 domain-containing protein n=1 Tax=Caulobacter sp. 17J65-9 TaxID=2709382 RepID=UPI0013CC9415|nr:DUF4136 domain-containing protein [Caulobacter sp. 17J65-9]